MTFSDKVLFYKQRLRNIYWRYHTKKRYRARQKSFSDSRTYWEQRYDTGGNSGGGSYGKFMKFKTDMLNKFVQQNQINTIIELGCGDGNQLNDVLYPVYLGFDVSSKAINICKELYKDDKAKEFKMMDEYSGESADLSLSLDVIYHLVEDSVFEEYMDVLFKSSNKYIIIYSSNSEFTRRNQGRHVKHRNFTMWVENNIRGWEFVEKIDNKHPYTGQAGEGSYADFYIYKKSDN